MVATFPRAPCVGSLSNRCHSNELSLFILFLFCAPPSSPPALSLCRSKWIYDWAGANYAASGGIDEVVRALERRGSCRGASLTPPDSLGRRSSSFADSVGGVTVVPQTKQQTFFFFSPLLPTTLVPARLPLMALF